MAGRPTHEGKGLACVLRLRSGERLRATTHCVDRFWERAATSSVRFADACSRLSLLTAEVGEFREPPAWAPPFRGRYVALGPDVGLIVRGDLAITTIASGGYVSDETRRRRNERKRAARERKARRRGR